MLRLRRLGSVGQAGSAGNAVADLCSRIRQNSDDQRIASELWRVQLHRRNQERRESGAAIPALPIRAS